MFPFPIGVAIVSKVGPVVDKSVRENQFIWSVVEPTQCGRVEDIGQLHSMAWSREEYNTYKVTHKGCIGAEMACAGLHVWIG